MADHGFDAFPGRVADDGAHLRRLVEAVADLERGDLLGQFVLELIVGVADADGDRRRQAALAGAAVSRAQDIADAGFDIGIGHDGDVIFGAALGLDAFAIARASFVDDLGHGAGADE